MRTIPQLVEVATKHGYSGPDPPVTDDDDIAFARALGVAASRTPNKIRGPTEARELVYLVAVGRIEV
jgi:hypothetical protein